MLTPDFTLFREMFKGYDENKDYQVVSMKGVQSKYMNAMVELIYNGETKIKTIECEEFLNLLKQYRIASKESLSEDKEGSTSKTNYENVIKKRENEIRSQKKEIIMFQKTFMQMKAEIYKMRAEKKDMKGKECNDQKDNEKSKKIYSERQTEAIPTEKRI